MFSADTKVADRIAAVIGNRPLAASLERSIRRALTSRFTHLVLGIDVWSVFKTALDMAIRDIVHHPRGRLFRRFVMHGPADPDDPPDDPSGEVTDAEGGLSDAECASAVEFIFSHMVNRFKAELAEILALEPCIDLIERLVSDGRLPPATQLYWGDAVQQRRRIGRGGSRRWGAYTKGADGLLVAGTSREIQVYGVIEVKSMTVSRRRIALQVDGHIKRLNGGVRLSGIDYSGSQVRLSPDAFTMMVVPSTWKLNRNASWKTGDDGARKVVYPEPTKPATQNRTEELAPAAFKIVLAWSREALEQCAYEMTYRYMGEVGDRVFSSDRMPKGWEDFRPEAAGRNALIMGLYYMPLRPLPRRQKRLAIKLYNVYAFGYPLAAGEKEMIWCEDVEVLIARASREPERLIRGRAFHERVQRDWHETAEGRVTSEKTIDLVPQGARRIVRRGRLDILVDPDDDFMVVVEIKATDWDRVRHVKKLLGSHTRQVWKYAEPYLDIVDTHVVAGLIYPRAPSTPGLTEAIESHLNKAAIQVVWYDES